MCYSNHHTTKLHTTQDPNPAPLSSDEHGTWHLLGSDAFYGPSCPTLSSASHGIRCCFGHNDRRRPRCPRRSPCSVPLSFSTSHWHPSLHHRTVALRSYKRRLQDPRSPRSSALKVLPTAPDPCAPCPTSPTPAMTQCQQRRCLSCSLCWCS